ncbi:hypothetical protein [Parapedobacter sp. 10938]|uniref:hypothetical protein n=1 Tax=Parapedobacter flavus TaxID=3110225 RepID=UPI002DB98B77|nr:hypothetical protein [Parapedobacter sp. 10938]MEC3878903.1 hypothetical protein [Parapedobacter sp. 10938]
MSLPTLNTVDPIALRYLMTETVFDAPAEPAPQPAAPSFVCFGQNKRNYLFLTDEKQHEWMPEADMDAFIKTLAALELAEADVALLNLARLAVSPSVDQLMSFFKPQVVVNLGTPFAWPEQDGLHVFHTHAFGEMLADAEKKRVFWTTIKRLLI